MESWNHVLKISGGIGGRRRRGRQRMRWLDGITDSMDVSLSEFRQLVIQGGLVCCDSWGCKESDMIERLNWTELNWKICSTSFPGAQSASFSKLNSPHRVFKVSSYSSTEFSLCRGWWQTPLLLLFSHWQMFLASAICHWHIVQEILGASLEAQIVKNLPAVWEIYFLSLSWEDPLRRVWQPTPVFLSGVSPWTEVPGRLQSIWSQKVEHDWVTKHTFTHLKCLFLAHIKSKTHFPDYIIVSF